MILSYLLQLIILGLAVVGFYRAYSSWVLGIGTANAHTGCGGFGFEGRACRLCGNLGFWWQGFGFYLGLAV